MLKRQKFDIDRNGIVSLENQYDVKETIEFVKNMRKIGRNGFSDKKMQRLHCSIPACIYFNEPLLIRYQQLKGIDPIAANKCLDLWLSQNPDFKV